MLLKNRVPGIEHRSVRHPEGLEHLRSDWVAIVRWLIANKVELVLVGPVAEAVRGNAKASGPVTVVPAPYRRNLERLARALASEHARLRVETTEGAGADPVPVKLTAEKLSENTRWTLRCGTHDLDVEGGIRAAGGDSGVPSYQELLYEAGEVRARAGAERRGGLAGGHRALRPPPPHRRRARDQDHETGTVCGRAERRRGACAAPRAGRGLAKNRPGLLRAHNQARVPSVYAEACPDRSRMRRCSAGPHLGTRVPCRRVRAP